MIGGGIIFEDSPVRLLTDISKYPKSIWEYWVYKQANKMYTNVLTSLSYAILYKPIPLTQTLPKNEHDQVTQKDKEL